MCWSVRSAAPTVMKPKGIASPGDGIARHVFNSRRRAMRSGPPVSCHRGRLRRLRRSSSPTSSSPRLGLSVSVSALLRMLRSTTTDATPCADRLILRTFSTESRRCGTSRASRTGIPCLVSRPRISTADLFKARSSKIRPSAAPSGSGLEVDSRRFNAPGTVGPVKSAMTC